MGEVSQLLRECVLGVEQGVGWILGEKYGGEVHHINLEKPGQEQRVLGDPLDRDHQEGGEVHPTEDLVLHLRHLKRRNSGRGTRQKISKPIKSREITLRKTLRSSFSLSMVASSIEEAACLVQYASNACKQS